MREAEGGREGGRKEGDKEERGVSNIPICNVKGT